MSNQTLFLATVLLLGCLVPLYLGVFHTAKSDGDAPPNASQRRLEDIPFNGQRAYEYLKQVVAIGPRRSGSEGMQQQQRLLEQHFGQLGGTIQWQRFGVRHPVDGSTVPMANLIVRWHPERRERILLCAHYDTRPFPDQDRQNPQGVFVGANDGGSGVAILMELAHEMPELKTHYGVDFALWDGEEFIFNRGDRYFLGSEYFARRYAEGKPPYHYRWGVLLDMVGDADLQIYQERNSMWWKDVRPLVEKIWKTAARLGVREFIAKKGQTVEDDHMPLHNIGRVAICDLIDFDYPYWHTQADTVDKCSALSLAKVGWVLREWLKTAD